MPGLVVWLVRMEGPDGVVVLATSVTDSTGRAWFRVRVDETTTFATWGQTTARYYVPPVWPKTTVLVP